MSIDKIQELIETILNEKKEHVITQIDSTKNTIVGQIEKLKDLKGFSSFSIPDDFDMGKGNADEIIDILYTSMKKITTSVNQLSLISNLLDGIKNFCQRAALFLIRDDKIVGWNGIGFEEKKGEISDKEIKKIFFSLSANTIFKRVLENRENYIGEASSEPDDHLVYNRFGGKLPVRVFVLPFFVKGKPQAVIYTDCRTDGDIKEKEIEMIAMVGEMSLELLPLKQKIMSRVKTREFEDEIKDETVSEMDLDRDEFPTKAKESDPAERLARVIINDIILYNQKLVDEGIKHKNLYRTMEDTILQSKELFLSKYKNGLAVFEKELVKTLAKGDPSVLKGYKFETL